MGYSDFLNLVVTLIMKKHKLEYFLMDQKMSTPVKKNPARASIESADISLLGKKYDILIRWILLVWLIAFDWFFPVFAWIIPLSPVLIFVFKLKLISPNSTFHMSIYLFISSLYINYDFVSTLWTKTIEGMLYVLDAFTANSKYMYMRLDKSKLEHTKLILEKNINLIEFSYQPNT